VKDYPSGDSTLRVLKGISVSLDPGRITAIVGPSGAGKSTLLHLMGFLDRPTEGDVVYRGRSLAALGSREQARVRNTHFGFVFQMYHLLPELSALENAFLPLMIRHRTAEWMARRGELHGKARDLLGRLGLSGRLHHRPSQLSGGERQRVAMARALYLDPPLLLADEPTGNLDSATGAAVLDLLLEEQRRRRLSMVLVTHDEKIAARCERVVVLQDGRVVA
jgi:lipoprotein-releasing system ATP-binding protein